jgi:hypothetical protein
MKLPSEDIASLHKSLLFEVHNHTTVNANALRNVLMYLISKETSEGFISVIQARELLDGQ